MGTTKKPVQWGWIMSCLVGLLMGTCCELLMVWQWSEVFVCLLAGYLFLTVAGKVRILPYFWGVIFSGAGTLISNYWQVSRLEIDYLLPVAIFLVLLVGYLLLTGAHLFARQVISLSVWIWMVVLEAVLVAWLYLAEFSLVFLLLTAFLGVCLIPLWSYGRQVWFTWLFALVYWGGLELGRFLYPAAAGQLGSFLDSPWELGAAVAFTILPWLISLYPAVRNDLYSKPVVGSRLSFKERLNGLGEVFMLILGFYSLALDKAPRLQKLAIWGRFLFLAAIGLELACLWFYPGFQVFWGWTMLLMLVGALLELSRENYRIFAVGWVFYTGVMLVVRWKLGINPWALAFAGVGFLLPAFIVACKCPRRYHVDENIRPGYLIKRYGDKFNLDKQTNLEELERLEKETTLRTNALN